VVVRAGRSKQRLTLRLDADLVDWFKAQGPDYQVCIPQLHDAIAVPPDAGQRGVRSGDQLWR
jgi:hypothetical protein